MVLLTGTSPKYLTPYPLLRTILVAVDASEKMASNDSMSESRVQALTALLPEIRTKLAVAIKSFQNHLARGTKYGFLTDDEMFEVFSGDNAAKNVDVLFKILKGKNNEDFDGFCSILEENEYDHWSATLQKKVSAICHYIFEGF